MNIWNGKHYDTDKIDHDMMVDYERFFAPFRERAVKVLEIGVWRGGSCLLWSDFFSHPQSQIIGIDKDLMIDAKRVQDIDPKVILRQCDQNDSVKLSAIAQEFGPFDIIIDDGSHRFDETQNCYKVLFDYVLDGGYYVIEDWGVGYWKQYHHLYADSNGNTMVTLITSIMESIPDTKISGYQVILDARKCLAFFKKGTAWN